MGKYIAVVSIFIIAIVMVGCQAGEKMVLLDANIAAVNITETEGLGGIGVTVLQSFSDEESIYIFEKAITTAAKQLGIVDVSEPDFDMLVEYENGFPTHAMHIWLGEEDEKCMFMYIEDDAVYLASTEMSKKLRKLIEG